MKNYSQEDYVVLTVFFTFCVVMTGFAILPVGKMWAILGFTGLFVVGGFAALAAHGVVLGVYWFIAKTLRRVVSKVSEKI